jgi:hypothetical protein
MLSAHIIFNWSHNYISSWKNYFSILFHYNISRCSCSTFPSRAWCYFYMHVSNILFLTSDLSFHICQFFFIKFYQCLSYWDPIDDSHFLSYAKCSRKFRGEKHIIIINYIGLGLIFCSWILQMHLVRNRINHSKMFNNFIVSDLPLNGGRVKPLDTMQVS